LLKQVWSGFGRLAFHPFGLRLEDIPVERAGLGCARASSAGVPAWPTKSPAGLNRKRTSGQGSRPAKGPGRTNLNDIVPRPSQRSRSTLSQTGSSLQRAKGGVVGLPGRALSKPIGREFERAAYNGASLLETATPPVVMSWQSMSPATVASRGTARIVAPVAFAVSARALPDTSADEMDRLNSSLIRVRERVDGMVLVEGETVVDRAHDGPTPSGAGRPLSLEPRRSAGILATLGLKL
jgi:hypothetical protein